MPIRRRRNLGGDILLKKSLILTDAQIKALPTTPIELVAAPGVGKIIQLISANFILDNVAGAYVANADSSFTISFLAFGNQSSVTVPQLVQGILQTAIANPYISEFSILPTVPGAGTFLGLNVAPSSFVLTLDGVENCPLVIGDYWAGHGINYTGGNAANTLKVNLWYDILTL